MGLCIGLSFFFIDSASSHIYSLSLHGALPILFSVLPWQLAFITSLSFILDGLAINGIQVIVRYCHGDTECKALFPYRWMVSAWDCALVEVSLYFIFRASVATILFSGEQVMDSH